MSWRTVVISESAKLDYRMGYMIVRKADSMEISINEMYMLILETTAVTISSYLLLELIKNKVAVIFCDEKRNPYSQLIPMYGSFDSSDKLRNQIKWKDDIKTKVWTMIVKDKINKQADFLKENDKLECELLYKYIEELKEGDITNREGHAAKVYFNALFGKDFSRGKDCAINSALNYGYSIILSCFTREIACNGYLTQLGLFHDNTNNKYNLASDLMEPFRILIDRKVVNMNIEKFDIEEKREIVKILESVLKIDSKKETLINAIKIYTKSIFDAIEDNNLEKIKLYNYEQ